MVIINKRQESKQKTRDSIFENTAALIRKKGIMSLTTAEIADKCGISHGSIFQHFGNRENLIDAVLEAEILRIATLIKDNCTEIASVNELLEEYLKVVSAEEDFFKVLYRELPFLPESVTGNVISMETIIRNSFFLSIKEQTSGIPEREITTGLDSFFAMIVRLLTLKELYISSGSVIQERKADLVSLFNLLFKRGGEKNEGTEM